MSYLSFAPCTFFQLQNIEQILAGDVPVIFFSLGSIVKGTEMPSHYEAIFSDAFASLPYKILWKFESDVVNRKNNVYTQKWFPQQDVLGEELNAIYCLLF